MRRITAVIPDDVGSFDLNALLMIAKEFTIESIPNGEVPEPKRKKHYDPDGKTAEQLVMEHYSPSAKFSINLARGWIEKKGYAPTTINGVMWSLVKAGLVSNIGKGRYTFEKPWPDNIVSLRSPRKAAK